MRAVLPVALACAAILASACVPDRDKEPQWRKAPTAWDPKGDTLTFGTKNLDQFNTMSTDERAAYLEQLKGKAGSFKGQASFKRQTELGEGIEDLQYGKYEVYAIVEEQILHEITIDYLLFGQQDFASSLPPSTYIEFTGTLADLTFKDDSKPRKLEIKVKDVTINRLKD